MTVQEVLAPKDLVKFPVIFNGRQPRLLGHARDIYEADRLAVLNNVAAQHCSFAELGGEKLFRLARLSNFRARHAAAWRVHSLISGGQDDAPKTGKDHDNDTGRAS
jgi:hypothetical protein